jgi:hypothetical protein
MLKASYKVLDFSPSTAEIGVQQVMDKKKPPKGGFGITGGSGEIGYAETAFSNSRPTD